MRMNNSIIVYIQREKGKIMEKIYLPLDELPMLKKENKRLGEVDSEIYPMMHIDNYIDIYKKMLLNPIYKDEIALIKEELQELQEEIIKRDNSQLVGEILVLKSSINLR